MQTTTIRVPLTVHDALKKISKKEGISVQEATTRAVEYYRYKQMAEEANLIYEQLRKDEVASADYDNDPPAWDSTLADGLEDY